MKLEVSSRRARRVGAAALAMALSAPTTAAVDVERVGSWQIVKREEASTRETLGYQAVLSVDRTILAFQCTLDGREQLGVRFATYMGDAVGGDRRLGSYTLDDQSAPIYLAPLGGGHAFEVDPVAARLVLVDRLRTSRNVGFRASDAEGIARDTASFSLRESAAAIDRTRALCDAHR